MQQTTPITPATPHGVTKRRDFIRAALRTGAYAAPVILAGTMPRAVGAVSLPATLTPTLALNVVPTSGIAGTVFSFAGTGLTPGAVYNVQLLAAPLAGPGGAITTTTANAAGNVAFTVNTAGFPAGAYTLGLNTTDNITTRVRASITVTAGGVAPMLSVSPTSGTAGTPFTVTGSGFTPNTLFDVRILDQPIPSMSNPPLPVSTVQSDAGGNLTATLDTTGFTLGVRTVTVSFRYNAQALVSTTFTIRATLFINGSNATSSTLAYGTSFTVTGSGFQVNGVLYRSIAHGPSGTFTFLPITTDLNGNFTNIINTTTSAEITRFNYRQASQTYAIVISSTQPTVTTTPNGPTDPVSGAISNILVQANVTVTGGPSSPVFGSDQ